MKSRRSNPNLCLDCFQLRKLAVAMTYNISMQKNLSIIGSTGSIGTQALEIVRARPNDFKIKAISAGKNIDLFLKQIDEFRPDFVTILSEESKALIKENFPKIKILKDINEIAKLEVDICLSAIVGIAGLEANLTALEYAKRLAIANKETLVAAGHIVNEKIKKFSCELIPVDSEHVAIHHALCGYSIDNVKEILLTASGGPFRTKTIHELKEVTVKEALKHPNWDMGAKITIDSSTLANKGLEVIEAKTLFNLNYDQIKVVVHPQSIVHSAVTFIDGNTIAQMGEPDMTVPIQYAMDYPQKKSISMKKDFNIFDYPKLEFEEPDLEKFPALALAFQAGKKGHSMPAVFNSANEAAVALFLEEKISYLDISRIIEEEMQNHILIEEPNFQDISSIHEDLKARLLKKDLSALNS
jgi:1-deoxy-D-xylulose-5-phosphate reductoisomerase